MANNTIANAGTKRRQYWAEQINKQTNAYSTFQTNGDRVVDKYRIEKQDATPDRSGQDKYNILYSSTETIRPSLYAQTPKVEVTKRHKDRKDPLVAQAVSILESSLTYCLEEVDIDEVMNNVVEDYALPGMGQAWVRYEPTFDGEGDSKTIKYEDIALDYVNWKDLLFGPCRVWKELPWGARKVYISRDKAKKRFGADKAARLQYKDNPRTAGDRIAIVEDKQAVVWEIWNKPTREVIWYSADYADDVLDLKKDPLKLKGFFPFPKPLRAISNTRTFIPRPLYSQYQSQAEELDNLTARIRHLTDALKVRGVYDGSANEIAHLLGSGGNKMIPVQNWAQFIGQGGVNGSIQWVPIKDIAAVLMQLFDARDRCKNEIYEITGFSDITRGLSKASETLGAQEIKNDWASARLRTMQKEVQRFIRDIMRIMAEIVAEQFQPASLALYTGFEVSEPGPEYVQAVQAAQAQGQPPPPDPRQIAVQQFNASVKLLRSEKLRCAKIGVETDSTILADEANERKDRMEFLSSIGAFMQQAAPTIQEYPQMAGLLGAMMMFTVRTFPASRPIEQEFERFQEALEANPPQPKQGEGNDAAAKAQSALQIAQLDQQTELQKQDKDLQFKASEAEKDRALELQKSQFEAQQAGIELQIKQTELEIKKAELALKQGQAQQDAMDSQQDRELAAQDQAHRHGLEDRQAATQEAIAVDDADRQDRQFQATQEGAAEDRAIAKAAAKAPKNKKGA